MPDREKVIKGLEYCEKYFSCCDKCPYWDGGTHCTADLAHDALALLKEQKAKTGHWIDTTKVFGFPRVQCSVCGSEQGAVWMYYCPICGAKMQEDGEVNDT